MKWKEYQNNPRFLIAMLPGLEIARDVLIEEIASIRAAIREDYVPQAVPVLDFGAGSVQVADMKEVKQRRKARRTRQARGKVVESTPGLSAEMTNGEFVLALAKKKAANGVTNAEITETAHKVGHSLANPTRLSVVINKMIHKDKTLERIAPGTVRART